MQEKIFATAGRECLHASGAILLPTCLRRTTLESVNRGKRYAPLARHEIRGKKTFVLTRVCSTMLMSVKCRKKYCATADRGWLHRLMNILVAHTLTAHDVEEPERRTKEPDHGPGANVGSDLFPTRCQFTILTNVTCGKICLCCWT